MVGWARSAEGERSTQDVGAGGNGSAKTRKISKAAENTGSWKRTRNAKSREELEMQEVKEQQGVRETKEVQEVQEIQEVNELLYSSFQVCHVVKPEASKLPAAFPLLNPAPSLRLSIKS